LRNWLRYVRLGRSILNVEDLSADLPEVGRFGRRLRDWRDELRPVTRREADQWSRVWASGRGNDESRDALEQFHETFSDRVSRREWDEMSPGLRTLIKTFNPELIKHLRDDGLIFPAD
jgi:hypothetical protein